MALTLTSPAFHAGAEIPSKYASEDRNLAPPLVFLGTPPGTRSLLLTVEDAEAGKGEPRVHWILYDIPPDAVGIPDGGLPLPKGAHEGLNDLGTQCYAGPAPLGGRHKYHFRLVALDLTLTGLRKPTLAQVEAAIKGHVLAHAMLIGTYEKKRKLL
ncbi:MAG: YbhB/YbcL family Raf kinase inhibitor-like protein [Planctomycetes bacterium]|nr:YbhB/YbcL family Raf kinase inhibitor-like protein [Planctomycetota bacterium]